MAHEEPEVSRLGPEPEGEGQGSGRVCRQQRRLRIRPPARGASESRLRQRGAAGVAHDAEVGAGDDGCTALSHESLHTGGV